jgi:hypothetical protein
MFGPCPVAELPGYRNFVLTTISQKQHLNQLDGVRINEEDF